MNFPTTLRRPNVVGLLCLATACAQVDVYAVTESSAVPDDADETDDTGNGMEATDDAAQPGDADSLDTVDGDETDDSTPPAGMEDEAAEADEAAQDDEPAQDDEGTDVSTPLCPTPVLEPGDTEIALQVGGMQRNYILHVPASYDGSEPAPLIVDFHGMGTSAATELLESPYPPVTDPEGVIMAFPDGLPGPLGPAWNLGPCCVRDADDLAFARALVAHVQERACIDPARVYAVGVLTGGGMVNHLACEAADLFAAVSPSAFDLLEETVTACQPSRPITVISFRGTEDTRVPYEGGPSSLVPGMPITFLGAESTLQRWAETNGCSGSPTIEDGDGCVFYSDCSGGVEVSLCTDRGGREGPGDANVAWPVLKRHTR